MKNKFLYKQNKIALLILITLFIAGALCTAAEAGMQTAASVPEQIDAACGEAKELSLMYDVIDGSEKVTGLGLRIHFSSKVVSALQLENVFEGGLIAKNHEPQDDASDFDNDPLTDKFIGVAWANIAGNWPEAAVLPLELGKIRLMVSSDCSVPRIKLNITSSSVSAGYGFQGKGTTILTP